MTGEKRRFIRFPFNIKAEMIVKDITYKVDEIINLSIGGCLLSVQAYPEPGTPCTLRINLGITGNELIITIEGSLVRSNQGDAAIKFTKIDPDSLLHLQKIARYNSPDPDRVEQEIREHPGIV
ncbi:PilZ domain-containing protein [Thermodesulfobacteriota bacterium]